MERFFWLVPPTEGVVKVQNVHERVLEASPERVGALLDGLARSGDGLWPEDRWPPMLFDRPLGVGAVGGHGPIRYVVEMYEPGRSIRFRFTAPPGFVGTHGFDIRPLSSGTTRLRHVLAMQIRGAALLTWPLVFRPLHDALIEDSLDRAQRSLGAKPAGSRWSLWVRSLRWAFGRTRPRSAADAGDEERGGSRPR